MDKNVEAQQIANKYLETEISEFQEQIQSNSKSFISATKEGFAVELDILKECFDKKDYSYIDNLINDLLPPDFKLNTKHIAYKALRYEFFQARIKAAQEMMKMCDGPHSFNFKGENIDLVASLTKFFAKPPSTDNWEPGSIQMRNQVLINQIGGEIRKNNPRVTTKKSLSIWISDDTRMKNSEKPLTSEAIRRRYLDDF